MMKRFLCITIIIMFCAPLVSAQKPKATIDPVIKLVSKEDSLQYALGVYMANYMVKGGFSKLKLDLFLAGLNDVYKSKPRIIQDSSVFRMISNYQEQTSLERNRFLEKELFTLLKNDSTAGKLPSGVRFIVIKQGSGRRPLETDSVTFHFKGTLPSGEVFENTFLRNAPVHTTPSNLIPALREMIPLMQEGSTYEIFIPSALGYGPAGNNKIPPNSALIVTLELIRIQ